MSAESQAKAAPTVDERLAMNCFSEITDGVASAQILTRDERYMVARELAESANSWLKLARIGSQRSRDFARKTAKIHRQLSEFFAEVPDNDHDKIVAALRREKNES